MLSRKRAVLDRTEGRCAVLRFEDGQELRVAKEEAAGEPGTSFTLSIMPESAAALERNDLARALLNEILDGEKERTKIPA